jgi:hypothetical protein
MPLSHAEFTQVFEALRAAYHFAGLRQMLRTRLGKRLDEISLGGDFKEIVFELLEAAERSAGWPLNSGEAVGRSSDHVAHLQGNLCARRAETPRTIRPKHASNYSRPVRTILAPAMLSPSES